MGYAKTEYKLKSNYVHCLWYTYSLCIVDEEKLHLPSIHLNELTECYNTTLWDTNTDKYTDRNTVAMCQIWVGFEQGGDAAYQLHD